MKFYVWAFAWVLASIAAVAEPVRFSAESVSYASGEETVTGYLAVPDGEGPFAAVILVHEWWGLNDWAKENARRFAGQGYVALAVDLYRGKVAAEAELARELSRSLSADRAASDLIAAVAYLRSRPDVVKAKVGSVGWCMGGGYSLALAVKQADLRASVICYGRLVTDDDAIARIGASVLGIFGGQDKGIPVDDVRRFEQALKDAKKDVAVHIYENAGHAFMNPNNKAAHRKDETVDAWNRIDAFFARTLKDEPGTE